MKTSLLFAFLATASDANGFGIPNQNTFGHTKSDLSMSTKDTPATEGKKAPDDAPSVNLGWNSHKAVVRYRL